MARQAPAPVPRAWRSGSVRSNGRDGSDSRREPRLRLLAADLDEIRESLAALRTRIAALGEIEAARRLTRDETREASAVRQEAQRLRLELQRLRDELAQAPGK